MADEASKTFDPSDNAGGELVYAGTGEKQFMLATLTVANRCSSTSEIFARGANGVREGARAITPGQSLQIRDWFIDGASSIFLFCNGTTGGDGCSVDDLQVTYTDDTPGSS